MTDTGAELAIEGQARQAIWPWPFKLVAAFSGFLFVKWLVLLVARQLLGYSTESRLEFNGRRLRVQSKTQLLGRVIRESDEFILARDMLTVGFERRFPYLLTLVGVLGTLVGAWVGVGWLIDSVQASYASIGMAGLGILSAGVLIDLSLGTVADFIGGKEAVTFTLRARSGIGIARRFRVVGIPEVRAKEFLNRMSATAP